MQHITRILCFAAGVAVGTSGRLIYTRAESMRSPMANVHPVVRAVPTPKEPDDDLHRLLKRDLSEPIAGIKAADLHDSFTESRPGHKTHEAIDIPAPRGTPIHAVADGVIAKLSTSARGGISVYQFDPDREYCFYYAHLDRYANRLRQGIRVKHGDVIGYVGSTGDASSRAPHLHLAIARLGPETKYWEGAPVDPYPVLSAIAAAAEHLN